MSLEDPHPHYMPVIGDTNMTIVKLVSWKQHWRYSVFGPKILNTVDD
jgi:hypothetical protein